MRQYKLYVRLTPYRSTSTIIQAPDVIAAKQIGEATFGKGNVINIWQVR
jgi:hypothetical protein